MAEDDWYGPFAGLLKHGWILVLTLGGAAFLFAGLIGYDMSRKTVGEPRWSDGPLWGDAAVGAAALAAGLYGFWRLRTGRLKADV